MPFSNDESLWDEFLAQWPIERLRTMTLGEYTKAGDKNCFTYWIEARLDEYGSIWGGSAFKFGIYSRNESSPKQGDGSLGYDDHYGWYRRFGETPEAAFETVRREVLAIVDAAASGQLQRIDDSELGPSYRWKIAFHYQDRSQPALFPCVFLRKPLLLGCGLTASDKATPLSTLYSHLAKERRSDEPVMAFSRRVWRDWVMANPLRVILTEGAVRNGYVPITLVSAPFPDSVRGGDNDDEAGERLRFRADNGWQFESDVRAPNGDTGRIRTRFGAYFKDRNVQAGDVIQIQPDDSGVYLITHLLKGGAPPKLAPSRVAAPISVKEPTSEYAAMPVNKILYGPPGTGKTYHTVTEALAILDPAFLADYEDDRAELKQRFDALIHSGHIRFVTFHQSFSYEDFVEGIRATTDEVTGALRYDVEDGVFKQICEAARSRVAATTGTGIDISGRKVWKISLGDAAGDGLVFDECMAEGKAMIGFGYGADLTGASTLEEIVRRVQAANHEVKSSDYTITALDRFVLRLKTGDLVVVSHGNQKFRAIGEVTGGYQHVASECGEHWVQTRPVKWLRRYEPPRPYPELMEKRFSQQTIYQLHAGSINMQRLQALLAAERADIDAQEDRVLIIDEINRGNVSRIFGELITLIEPSKREGADEALEVTLPYSKERFSVPSNVHLIGTMNTADRSLAGLDVALRRRFDFVEMLPDVEALHGMVVEGVPVATLLSTMNRRIEVLLGRDYMLGHAYFMRLKDDASIEALATIFRQQVLPLLQEYFFEDWQKIAWVFNDHRKTDPSLRFLEQTGAGMADLFGSGVELSGEGRLWTVNQGAFDRPAAYGAIIQAPQGIA